MEKAIIINEETGEELRCLFNPSEYTFSKSNKWTPTSNQRKNVPDMKFGGGGKADLTLDLLFDTYEKGEDVRKYTNKLWDWMVLPDEGRAPPRCRFQWGQSWSYEALIESLTQTFSLFLSDGTPVRSIVKVGFIQAGDEQKFPGQNPTTLAKPGYKMRQVREGETLDLIAFAEYGDPALWRFLADINRLHDPLKLEVGQILAIAPMNEKR